MTVTKIAALLFLLIGGPCLAFFIVDFMRGASLYITPFLIGAFLLTALLVSAVLAMKFLSVPSRSETRWWSVPASTFFAMLLFLCLAGGAQVLAESIAAWNWERKGLPFGDHGSYREFYPGDSGMAHYPTPWILIPGYGVLTAIVWGPLLVGVLLIIGCLEAWVRRSLRGPGPVVVEDGP